MKKDLLLSFAGILTIIVFHGCKKMDSTQSNIKVEKNALQLITEARTFFDQNIRPIKVNPESNADNVMNLLSVLEKSPDWGKSKTQQLKFGLTIVTPITFEKGFIIGATANKKVKISEQTYLIMYKNKNNQFITEVVIKIPDSLNTGPRFSGMVIVTDWNGKIVKALKYEKNLVYPVTMKVQNKKGAVTEGFSCTVTDYYVTVTAGNQSNSYYSHSTYQCVNTDEGFTETFSTPNDGGSGGGGGFGEVGGTPGVRPSRVGGNNRVKEISVDIKDPCIKDAVSTAMYGNFVNKIQTLFNKIFSGSEFFNVVISDFPLTDNTIYGKAKLTDKVYGYWDIDIVLNSNLLKSSSKELIVATLFHEMVHAMFDANKIKNNDLLSWNHQFQHQIMASSYVNKMSTALREVFPSLSKSDADALSWEGLQGTLIWDSWKKSDPTGFNNMLLQGDQFDEKHKGGTRCK